MQQVKNLGKVIQPMCICDCILWVGDRIMMVASTWPIFTQGSRGIRQ